MDKNLAEVSHALSIKQPWLWAISDIPEGNDPKRVENRTWKPNVRAFGKRIALAASTTTDGYAMRVALPHIMKMSRANLLPVIYQQQVHGAIVCTAVVAGYVDRNAYFEGGPVWADSWDGSRDYDVKKDRWHVYGQYGWLLRNVQKLAQPLPHKGALGVWKIDQEIWSNARYA